MSTFKTITAFTQRVQRVTRDFGPDILAIKTAELLTDIRNRHGRYPTDVTWKHLKKGTIARKKRGDTPLLESTSMRNSVQQAPMTDTMGEVYTDAQWATIHEEGYVGKKVKIPARPIWKPAVKKIEKTLKPKMLQELARRLNSI